MPDPAAIIATVVAGILGGVGVWWSRRKLRDAGVGQDQSETTRNLRELADTWEQKFDLEHEARMNAETQLAEVKSAQLLEQTLARQCRDDLDDARSEIRMLRRQPERRQRPTRST